MAIFIRVFLILIFQVLVCLQVSLAGESPMQIKVQVEGIQGQHLANVLAYLSLEQEKDFPSLTEGIIKRMYRNSDQEIRSALQPFGFYNPSNESDLTFKDGQWHAFFKIQLGPPVILSKLDLNIQGEGKEDEAFQNWLKQPLFQEGQILEHVGYEKAKKELQEMASNRGYLDSKWVAHSIYVDPVQNSAEVILHFDTGPRYLFGDVIFIQEKFDRTFLQRFVHFQKGDAYSVSKLFQLQNDLSNSDYFSRVEVNPRRDLAEKMNVPIEINLEPGPRNKYSLGIGYGTDTGIRGSAGWENRRINRKGHRMKAQVRGSLIKKSFQTQYIIPLKDPRSEHLDYSAGWVRENTDTSNSETFLLGISHAHLRGRWQETVNANFEHEVFEVADEKGVSNLLIPGITWSRTQADDRIFTHQGGRLVLDIKGAHRTLISDATFLQLRLNSKYIYTVGSFGRFIFRGDGGASLVDEFPEVPVSLRFFTGGDQTVRGYPYNSLGPKNNAGQVTGGRHLLVGSVEYEQMVFKKWSLAVFFDAGNAIQEISKVLGSGFDGSPLSDLFV
jgi:translocation and assembly module TamA